MAYGYTAHHAEWLATYAYTTGGSRPSTFEVLLYDDETDDLDGTDDVADIDTEPTGLAREELTWADVAVGTSGLHARVETVDASFDLTGVDGDVDSVGVVWDAQLDGDSAAVPHLMIRQPMDDRYDLAEYSAETTVAVAWQVWPYY